MRPALLVTSALLLVAALGLGTAVATTSDAGNVTLYSTTVDFDDADAVEAAIANGTAEPADELVAGETLVVAIGSERLADDLDSRNGSATDRFFDALDGDADLRIEQTNPGPQQTRKVIPVGSGNATVYRGGATTYLLVDTGAVEYRRHRSGENDPAGLRDGDQFAVAFGYDLDERATGGPEFDLYTTEAEFSPFSSYDPLAPEVVNRSVKVNVEPDDAIVARVTLDDDRTLTDAVEPVEWSGWPGVSLDLRGVEPGTEYVLELVHDGEVVDRYDGTVRDPDATVTDAEVTEVEGYTAVNVTAELSHGGEVRVLNAEGAELGSTSLDSEGKSIAPGVETDLTILLTGEATEELRVRAAREAGASEEFYGGPDAELTVEFGDREIRTPTPPETSTETPTVPGTSQSMEGTSTPTTERTSTPTSPNAERSPGFGPIAVLGALLALVVAAVRRA